jgi:signal transduction histidine kinase
MRPLLFFPGLMLLAILATHTVSAQSPYILNDPTITHRLDADVKIFIDPGNTLDILQVSNPEFQSRFERSKGNLTFGYLKATIWLKVQTKTALPGVEWLLSVPAPFLEYVDFYQLNTADNTWKHSLSGYYRKHSERDISHTGHVVPMIFNASDSINTTLIKISGLSPKTFPLNVVEKEKFNQEVRYEDVGYGIFFGILVVMFFYNLLLFIVLKQVNYFLYICTIVCTFLIFSSASGYAGKFLWPDMPLLNFYAGRMTLPILAIFLSIFTIGFLDVRRYSSVMFFLLMSIIPLAILSAILVSTEMLSSAGNNLISLATIIYMTTGIVCTAKGNKTARYYIAAWAVYLAGGLLLTLRNSGVLDFNFWTTHFVEIGAALETTLIAFALGDRYRRYKQEKEEIQMLALKAQQEANEKLELKVRERTEQLSNAYEELRATHETNKLQTRIIENKNAELDAFFYRISHDLKGPISSLLGLSALAKREVKDEHAIQYFDKHQSQAERLNNIIIGLIHLTKLNGDDLRKERIDFDKLIDDCILSFDSHENFTKIKFEKHVHANVEFYSEWTLINAILQNLIENSIKYAGKKSPFIHIHVWDDANSVTLKVDDNGQGIPKEHQAKIFDMFYRATQEQNGSGLGLYILKRSVDRLRGTIDMRSEVGVGSTFTVKLPKSK